MPFTIILSSLFVAKCVWMPYVEKVKSMPDLYSDEENQNKEDSLNITHNRINLNSSIEFVTGLLLRYINEVEMESIHPEPNLIKEKRKYNLYG